MTHQTQSHTQGSHFHYHSESLVANRDHPHRQLLANMRHSPGQRNEDRWEFDLRLCILDILHPRMRSPKESWRSLCS